MEQGFCYEYLNAHPFYDKLPERLSNFIGRHVGHIGCLDVGANIGDTIAAFKQGNEQPNDFYVAIEPNPFYRKFLTLNWGLDKSVKIESCICSSEDGADSVNFLNKSGTASIVFNQKNDPTQNLVEKRTIDSIVKSYKNIVFNLLKVDTDGHDFEVLNGSKEFIREKQPFVIFEVDNFNNLNFLKDLKNSIKIFVEANYTKVFIYDNFGIFLGVYDLLDLEFLEKLMLYKLSKHQYYFDFLLMRDDFASLFETQEKIFYQSKIV